MPLCEPEQLCGVMLLSKGRTCFTSLQARQRHYSHNQEEGAHYWLTSATYLVLDLYEDFTTQSAE